MPHAEEEDVVAREFRIFESEVPTAAYGLAEPTINARGEAIPPPPGLEWEAKAVVTPVVSSHTDAAHLGHEVGGGSATGSGGEGDVVEIDLEQWRSSKSATGYRGVTMSRGRYTVMIRLPSGERKYLGTYDTTEEAARVYARSYLELYGGLPELRTVAERETACGGERDNTEIDLEQWRASKNPTGYRGVCMSKGRYAAKIWLPSGKQKHLGMYDTAEEAGRVYARKHLELHGDQPEVIEERGELDGNTHEESEETDGGEGNEAKTNVTRYRGMSEGRRLLLGAIPGTVSCCKACMNPRWKSVR